MAGGQTGDRVDDAHPVVGPVRPVGDAVVGRDELVGVVLAFHRGRNAVVHERHDAADRKVLGQEALPEGMPGDRVAERRERQLIRRRGGRVVGKPRLHGVEYERSLGQPHRGSLAARADGGIEVAFTLVDRLADTGPVQTDTGIDLFSQGSDTGEETFQGVALNLACRVVDLRSFHTGEPVLARHPDVLVVGNPEDVGTAQRICRSGVRRRGRRRRAAGRSARLGVIGGCRSDTETSCDTGSYQHRQSCE